MATTEEILRSVGRTGWSVIGSRPATETTTDTSTYPPTTKKTPIPGQWVWIISDGKQGSTPDEMTVQTGQGAGGGEGVEGPGFEIVAPPKKTVPSEGKPQADWQSQGEWQTQPDGSKVFKGYNPATKQWEPIPGVAAVPASEKDKPAPKTLEQNGTVYERQDDGTWTPAKGIPTQPPKAEAPIFKEFEGKLYQWVPDASKPGGGTFTLAAGLEGGGHPPGDFIEGGFKVRKVWNEGTKKYEVDPSVEPEAWSPEAKAQAAKTAAAPTEGKTRPNIVGGYHVTQTYQGGEWTTTDIGARATPAEVKQLTAGTEQPYIAQTDESGQVTWAPNQNYQGPKAPTTRGELAQRVALLQSQAMQMKDKIQADKSIPPDQQAARFSTWYDQNVAPQAGALEQQQQAIIQDENLKAIEQQRTNLASASSAMQGLMPYRVGPGYGQAFESLVSDTANTQFPGVTNKPWNPPAGWSTFQAPNLDEHIKNLVSAQTAPAPGMDIQGMLNRSQWAPGGGLPPGAETMPMQGAAPTPEAMPNTNPNNNPLGAIGNNPMLAAMQARNRQLASQQTAAATGNPNNSPFGAIGPGGMPPPMPLPQAAPMPMATGAGPLAYNPAPFRGVMPMLPGYDYSQTQNPYQWPFGGGGGGNSGFTPGP